MSEGLALAKVVRTSKPNEQVSIYMNISDWKQYLITITTAKVSLGSVLKVIQSVLPPELQDVKTTRYLPEDLVCTKCFYYNAM